MAIDDDDVTHVIMLWPFDHPVLTVIGICVIGALWHQTCENQRDCAAQHCTTGTARLLDGECVCAEAPRREK